MKDEARRDSDTPDRKEPPTWQIAVPFVVAAFALIALVMFVYGFYVVRSR